MAKIPDETALGASPVPRPPRGIPNIPAVGSGYERGTQMLVADANQAGRGGLQLASGLERAGAIIEEGERVIRTRQDAVSRAKAYSSYTEAAEGELRKLQTEADLSDLGTVRKYGEFLNELSAKSLNAHGGSRESGLLLEQKLEEMRGHFSAKAGALSLEAGDRAINDLMGSRINSLTAATWDSPGSLANKFTTLDSIIDDMSPGLTPDKERIYRTAGRERIAEAAIGSLIGRGAFNDAERLLSTPGLSEVLGEKAQNRIQLQLISAKQILARAQQEGSARVTMAETVLGRRLSDPERRALVFPNPAGAQSEVGKIAADVSAGFIPPEIGAAALNKKINDPTALQRDLEAAGLTPGTPQYSQAMMAAILKPQAQVNIGEETSFEKGYGGKLSEQAAEVHTAAEGSRKLLARLGQFTALSETFETSKLAPTKTTVAAWADALGIGEKTLSIVGLKPTDAITGQAMSAISNAMLLSFLGPGGFPAQNFSDKDREFMEKTLPQISNTPGGNKVITQAMGLAAERSVSREKRWLKAQDDAGKDANKAETYRKFLREWNEYVEKTPLFPEIRSEDEFKSLKSGTVFTAPDGSVRMKP